jgi:O-antigen ligase
MPNAHNGYYDTVLEMGYIGLVLLVVFIAATLHGIGRVVDRDLVRGWSMLSIALFVIVYNGLESTWMRGFEFLWVVFLILAAEIAKYWQPSYYAGRLPTRPSAHGSRRSRRVFRQRRQSKEVIDVSGGRSLTTRIQREAGPTWI